jgi:hypothetical protein
MRSIRSAADFTRGVIAAILSAERLPLVTAAYLGAGAARHTGLGRAAAV